MADSSRRQDPALMSQGKANPAKPFSVLQDLLDNPRGYSFPQGVRLLRHAHGTRGIDGAKTFLREQLRVRPYLSLGFPPTDLVEVKELQGDEGQDDERLEARPPLFSRDEQRRFQITATFLGLYGPSSPLPTFYTEELLDELSEDKSVTRDFLDILNHIFFMLFALADVHYNISHQICEELNEDVLLRLYSLVGLGSSEIMRGAIRNPGALLRATGLLTQFPRSAAGLRGLLADRIGAPVHVHQCEPRVAVIPEDQRCRLGQDANILGSSTWIGSQVEDAMGKIRIVAGPMDADTFARTLPGEPDHDELLMLIRFYCTQPVEFDLEFFLLPEEARPGRLGDQRWSRLGCDVWLASEPLVQARAVFSERRRIWDENNQRSIVL
jgi:type VI secretion system protein ImpH